MRPGLFRKIYFKADASDFDAKLSSFLQFFGSAHYIARYVKSLSISTRDSEGRHFRPGRVTTSHLKLTIPIFPGLHELSFTRIDWRATETYQMSAIEALRLTTVSSPDCEHWLHLVWTFPNLRHLAIDRFFIPMTDALQHSAPAPVITDLSLDNLEVLEIQYTPLASNVLTALRRASELKTLRMLSVNLIHGSDVAGVSQALLAAHAALTHLHLTVTFAAGQGIADLRGLMRGLPFPSLTSLHTLAFSLTYNSPNWLWDSIVEMVACTSASLQALHFTFLFRYYNTVPWGELDKVLVSLPSLKKVEFVNHLQVGEAIPKDFYFLMELGLPLTHERGLLFCP